MHFICFLCTWVRCVRPGWQPALFFVLAYRSCLHARSFSVVTGFHAPMPAYSVLLFEFIFCSQALLKSLRAVKGRSPLLPGRLRVVPRWCGQNPTVTSWIVAAVAPPEQQNFLLAEVRRAPHRPRHVVAIKLLATVFDRNHVRLAG